VPGFERIPARVWLAVLCASRCGVTLRDLFTAGLADFGAVAFVFMDCLAVGAEAASSTFVFLPRFRPDLDGRLADADPTSNPKTKISEIKAIFEFFGLNIFQPPFLYFTLF